MRKPSLTLVLIALPSLSFAATSNNTIKFQGEVADQTCNVDVNGTAKTPIVLMPTVSLNDLKSTNAVAGKTNFTINLTGCTAATDDTDISTTFVGNNVTTAGNMGNAGTAKEVEVQLLDTKGQPVDMSGGLVSVPGIVLKKTETSTSQNLSVQYITEKGTATAGTVLASAQYAITYP